MDLLRKCGLSLFTSRKPEVLFIDDRIPNPGLGAGYPRAHKILAGLADIGYQITFYPFIVNDESRDDAHAFLPAGTRYLGALSPHQVKDFLAARRKPFDCVWVSRPHNMRVLLDQIPEPAAWNALIPHLIYDAEAVFSLREKVRAAVLGLPFDEQKIDQEKGLVKRAQRVVAVSGREASFFTSAGVPVDVLVHSLNVTPTPGTFAERDGFIFLGPVVNDQSPNADALRYLLRDVWPRIRAVLPRATLKLVGTNTMAADFQRLAAGGVEFLGWVTEQELFGRANHARVHIVPTRYAAGVPLKAMTLAALGVPMVTTLLIQEQLGWSSGELVPADWKEAGRFADACIHLHQDPALWASVREKSLVAVRGLSDPMKFHDVLRKIMNQDYAKPTHA